MYKPMETAVSYLGDKYQTVKYALVDVGQKIIDSLTVPPSNLEFVLVGVQPDISPAYLRDVTHGSDYHNPPIYFFAKNHKKNPPPSRSDIERREKQRKEANHRKKRKTL